MTWGGYKGADDINDEPELAKEKDTFKPLEIGKAEAEAQHLINVEVDELERKTILNQPPHFRVIRKAAGDFIILPLKFEDGRLPKEE